MATKKEQTQRNVVVQTMIENPKRNAGEHHNREYDVKKGKSRKAKHQTPIEET
mgnify:CR=1 FL=1